MNVSKHREDLITKSGRNDAPTLSNLKKLDWDLK